MKKYFNIVIIIFGFLFLEAKDAFAITNSTHIKSFLDNLIDRYTSLEEYVKHSILADYSNKNNYLSAINIHIVDVLFFVILFCIVSVLVLSMVMFLKRIFHSIIDKKNENHKHTDILFVTEMLFSSDNSISSSDRFKSRKKYLVKLIYHLHNDLIGASADKLREMFIANNLHRYTLNKAKSFLNYKKAQYIKALYVMKIEEVIPFAKKYFKSNHENLRTESLLANITFSENNDFSFLYEIQYKLTDWEQIRIYDLLIKNSINVPDFSNWLNSPNKSVVVFCLRMIRLFHQDVNIYKVATLLDNEDPTIRFNTLTTLRDFKDEFLLPQFISRYKNETDENKLQIIKNISSIRNNTSIEFLQNILLSEKFYLKLEAALTLKEMGKDGREILYKANYLEDKEVVRIVKHALDIRI